MKASCVLALEAFRALNVLDLFPKGPVTLLLTCDEESGSKTGRPLVEEEARRVKQALVLEPPAPGGEVKTARKGVGHVDHHSTRNCCPRRFESRSGRQRNSRTGSSNRAVPLNEKLRERHDFQRRRGERRYP